MNVAGVRTGYLDAGAGEPVVAIHGVPTSSELFEPLLPALAGGGAGVRRATVGLVKRAGAIPPDLAERWARPWTRRRVLRSLDLLAPWRLGAAAPGVTPSRR